MSDSQMTQELRSLYEITGDIKDINTVLVQRDRVEKAEKDAERLDWLNLAGNRFAFHLSGTWYSRKDHGSPYRKQGNIRSAIDAAMEASK